MRLFEPNIRRLEERRDVPRLIAALNDGKAGVREAAATALGRLGPAGIPLLAELVATADQGHYFARHRALKVLGQIGGERALQILKAKLDDGDELTSQRVVEALLAFAGEVPPSLFALAVRKGGRMARRLAAAKLRACVSPTELDLLAPALGDPEPDTKVSTALFFLSHGDPRGFEALVQILENPPRDNGGHLDAHACAKETLLRHMNAQPDAVPRPALHRLARLQDTHRDVTYYLEDDPSYDAGHDTVTQDHAEVRATARQALREQVIAGQRDEDGKS